MTDDEIKEARELIATITTSIHERCYPETFDQGRRWGAALDEIERLRKERNDLDNALGAQCARNVELSGEIERLREVNVQLERAFQTAANLLRESSQ